MKRSSLQNNNMPLIYTTTTDENYPPITTMLRKTKTATDAGRAVSKRPALATLTNLQNVPTSTATSNDLGKQIRQRQANPFSVRVDAKKPSPKQRQMATRLRRTTCTKLASSSSAANTSSSSGRQSTLSAFMSSSAPSASNAFTIYKDRTTPTAATPVTAACCAAEPRPTPMSVEPFATTSSAPLAPPPARPCSSASNLSIMECEDAAPGDTSTMSVECTGVKDIDADCHPEFDSPEYSEDIDRYLRQKEVEYRPRPLYVLKQAEIRFHHRALTVNWMHEVCQGLKLNQTVFQLAVSYMDRFLSKIQFKVRRLQLLAIACLYIAKKVDSYGEGELDKNGNSYAATFVWMTDNSFKKEELLKMERLVLSRLGFEVNTTVSTSFADRFLKAAEADCRERFMMMYLVDRALVKGEEFLRFAPSLLTAAAIGLARAHLRPTEPIWTPTLAHYTKYSLEEIRECMGHLLDMYKTDVSKPNADLTGPWEQYRAAKYMNVLETTPLARLPSH